jgi:hypothetical protein
MGGAARVETGIDSAAILRPCVLRYQQQEDNRQQDPSD